MLRVVTGGVDFMEDRFSGGGGGADGFSRGMEGSKVTGRFFWLISFMSLCTVFLPLKHYFSKCLLITEVTEHKSLFKVWTENPVSDITCVGCMYPTHLIDWGVPHTFNVFFRIGCFNMGGGGCIVAADCVSCEW